MLAHRCGDHDYQRFALPRELVEHLVAFDLELDLRLQRAAQQAVIDGIKQKLTALRTQIPSDIKLEVIRDQSRYIYSALHEIDRHLILGSILACLVVLAFMRSWRSTAISCGPTKRARPWNCSMPTCAHACSVRAVVGSTSERLKRMSVSRCVGTARKIATSWRASRRRRDPCRRQGWMAPSSSERRPWSSAVRRTAPGG